MKKMFWLDAKPSIGARLCARLVDYSLFYLLFSLTSMVFPFYVEDLYYIGFAFLIPIMWVPLESLFISKYKTTPGKGVFGIRIENHLGGKLSFGVSLKRALFWGVRPGIIRQKKIRFQRWAVGMGMLLTLLGGAYFEKEIAVLTTGFEKYKAVDGWIEYASSDGKFRVILPEDPECEEKILPVPSQKKNLNYSELKSYQTKKVYYSVTYIELPKRWKMAGASRLLQGALDLIVDHTPNAQILTKTMTKHRNFRALDFHLSQGEDEVQGRLILVGTTLFRLSVVYPPSVAHQLQHQEFLDSFEVKG